MSPSWVLQAWEEEVVEWLGWQQRLQPEGVEGEEAEEVVGQPQQELEPQQQVWEGEEHHQHRPSA